MTKSTALSLLQCYESIDSSLFYFLLPFPAALAAANAAAFAAFSACCLINHLGVWSLIQVSSSALNFVLCSSILMADCSF